MNSSALASVPVSTTPSPERQRRSSLLSAVAPKNNAAGSPASNPANNSASRPAGSRAGTGRTSGHDLALAGIAHDARNLVTALRLCADMLTEPGVLTQEQSHLGGQVQGLADAADHIFRRLSSVSRLATLASQIQSAELPVENPGEAVQQLRNLLAAVAGPAVDLQIACMPCAGPIALSEESLTRILLNLVRNAADAMPAGGRVRITAQRGGGASFLPSMAGEGIFADAPAPESQPDLGQPDPGQPEIGNACTVLLAVEDDGPGIPAELLERIFEPGFSTRRGRRPWPESQHHGLGLSIVRQLTEAAGGTIRAVRPACGGARFELEFPLTNVTPALPSACIVSGQNRPR